MAQNLALRAMFVATRDRHTAQPTISLRRAAQGSVRDPAAKPGPKLSNAEPYLGPAGTRKAIDESIPRREP